MIEARATMIWEVVGADGTQRRVGQIVACPVVRLALGDLTLRNRCKLLWLLLLGRVVEISGSPVLSFHAQGVTPPVLAATSVKEGG